MPGELVHDYHALTVIDPYVESGTCREMKLTLAAHEDVDRLENVLDIRFPDGYREFVTTLGQGDYCNFIRVDLPKTIEQEWRSRQEFLNEYFFWEMGEEILSKEKVIESIQIAGTIDGDVMIFHPSNREMIYVLPRNDDMLYEIGSNLYEAIDWLCVSHSTATGFVGQTHERRYFVPYNPLQYHHGVLKPEGY